MMRAIPPATIPPPAMASLDGGRSGEHTTTFRLRYHEPSCSAVEASVTLPQSAAASGSEGRGRVTVPDSPGSGPGVGHPEMITLASLVGRADVDREQNGNNTDGNCNCSPERKPSPNAPESRFDVDGIGEAKQNRHQNPEPRSALLELRQVRLELVPRPAHAETPITSSRQSPCGDLGSGLRTSPALGDLVGDTRCRAVASCR